MKKTKESKEELTNHWLVAKIAGMLRFFRLSRKFATETYFDQKDIQNGFTIAMVFQLI